jgi:hypothetical protein
MTRQPDFTGVRIKVERAKHHFRDLERRIERFREANPYEPIRYDEPDTGDLVYKAKIPNQPPPYWSAIVGDCVHNLRSSLDLLVCEMVRAEGEPVRERTGFPIYRSIDSFTNALKSRDFGKVEGAPQAAVDLIMKAEPYVGADNPLGQLHQLDIEDKHKLLVPVGVAHEHTTTRYTLADVVNAYPDLTTIKLHEIPTAENIGIVMPRLSFPLEDGAEIYRVRASLRNDPRAQMHMYPEFGIEIAFGEIEVVDGEPIIPTLHQLIQFVEGFVELFPPLFSQESS